MGLMAKRKKPGEELELAERAQPIVALRQEGLPFREIAARLGTSKSTCHRRYSAALAQLPPIKDLEEHRAEAFIDLRLMIEELRPRVHGLEGPPRRRDVGHFLAAIEKEMRLIGLGEPAQDEPSKPTKRASTNGHPSTSAHVGPRGSGMWSMVLEFPRDD